MPSIHVDPQRRDKIQLLKCHVGTLIAEFFEFIFALQLKIPERAISHSEVKLVVRSKEGCKFLGRAYRDTALSNHHLETLVLNIAH